MTSIPPLPPVIDRPSPNHSDRKGQAIRHLVLHYTALDTVQEALDKLCDPNSDNRVSAHYLVGKDGTIFRLVPDIYSAWHAGVSWWRGTHNLNESSIGIEIDNRGDGPFPDIQMQSVLALSHMLVQRYHIAPVDVVGHADIAPTRKEDPGAFFDWTMLARHGVGVMPVSAAQSPGWTPQEMADALARFGYEISDPAATIRAFQRHFRPEKVDGVADARTQAILAGLLTVHPPAPPPLQQA